MPRTLGPRRTLFSLAALALALVAAAEGTRVPAAPPGTTALADTTARPDTTATRPDTTAPSGTMAPADTGAARAKAAPESVVTPPAAPPESTLAPRARAPVPPVDVRVAVEDYGDFVIRLDRARVPNAVSLFLTLSASGAFDHLAFHRVIPGLLVQTGDPLTRDDDASNDGTWAPPWRLPAPAPGGTHHRGTVSLAWRDDDPASAGTQWFVTLSDVETLDGHATPIGEVIQGMDVVDRIAQVSTFRDRRPLRPVRIRSVRLEPIAPAESSGTTPGSPAAKSK